MEKTLTALSRFLQARPGFEAVLIAPTLSMGRQLLEACAARFGGVLGVRVHTPDTLALELCGTDCLGVLSRDAGALLLLSLLREKGASWPFFSALDTDRITLPAARALLDDLLLLEREGVPLPAGQEDPRLAGLSALLAAYQAEKNRRGLWGRYDLFARAAGRWKERPLTVPAAICANVTGEGIVQTFLRELNASVLPVPCAWQTPQVPALFLPQTEEAPAAQLRFVKSYGQENETLFPFYDLLERQIPFGQAAILCAGQETLPLLWEQAVRLGVPLTLDGGLPLEKGKLLPLLRALASWYGGGCPVEGLPGLMAGGLAVPHGAGFLKYLRKNHVGHQLSRYLDFLERTKKPLDGSAEEALLREHNEWIAFCAELKTLFEETATVEEGLALLRPFLLERYVKTLPQIRGPEYAALLSALENLVGTAPGGSFSALLPQLLDAAARTPWQSAAPRDGAVHAASLSKGAFLGRPHTYILGLSRDALTAPGQESPLLRNEERLALGLPRSDAEAELPAYHLGAVLAAARGEVTLSYSCFDTEKLLAAHPAPVYEALRGTAEPMFFGYHRPVSLTGADRWLEGSPAPVIAPVAETAGLPEDFVFSASSLEGAMQCPRRFYFQYILKIPQVEKTDLSKRKWLPANAFGSLVHETLEDYFDRLIETKVPPDLEEVWAAHLAAYEPIWPCADPTLREREARRAKDCVLSAVRHFQHSQAGSAPLATELTFGRKAVKAQPYSLPEEFTLRLDEEMSFPFTGSIDRLDRLPNGEGLAILDYKTGRISTFLREADSKLQYYLYAKAAEQLGLGQVKQAVYLFLTPAGVHTVPCPDPGEDAERMDRVKALVKLLRGGRAADIAQPVWQGDVPICYAGDKDRQKRLNACASYCPYAALCQEVCP